jgi:phosphoglycolate phosphatase
MRYTTVIFDLDGTLLNTLDDIHESVNYSLSWFDFPEQTVEQTRAYVGNGASKLIERSLPQRKDTPNFDEILAFYVKHYNDNSLIKTAPYEGVMDLLRELSEKEYKLAVVSNKPDKTVRFLVRHFFGGLISVAIGEKTGINRKPAPDTVNAAMNELFSFPYECVYVGDSEVDITTAKNAGIDCISVPWGFRSRDFLVESGAKMIANNPSELLKML